MVQGTSKHNACIWLAVGIAGIVVPRAAAQHTRPDMPAAAPSKTVRLSADLSDPDSGKEGPAILALAGSTLAVAAVGKPGASCVWQFGYRDTVLRQDRLHLDEKGVGQVTLLLPSVRARVECTLLLMDGDKKTRRRLTVFPSARLARAAKLIRALRLGVIDDTGAIQKALKAEGVAFDDLSTRLLQDSFDGGALLVAGFEDAALLNDTCQRLPGRIEKGMSVVIVNPPAKWSGWGLSRQRLSSPVTGSVTFAASVGRAIRPTDLGTGPWQSVLRPAEPWTMLAWVEQAVKDDTGKVHRVRRPLIALRKIGRGNVVVVALIRQIVDPLGDALSRGILDELVLWILGQRLREQPSKE